MYRNEKGYLNVLRDVLFNGNLKKDRTGTGTRCIFGVQMKFDLSDNQFPLLTTKKLPFNIIAEELFWFLRGSTDNHELQEKGIKIWDLNSDRNFLDSLGFFERKINDIGPGYGFQWRHFGADYVDCKTDYTNQGIDQIENIIHLLKNCPHDRRIILTSWNPVDVPKCNLPPCHCFAQFSVINNELSCCLTQRSGDMALGVPFNIASYSLLTYILADLTNLKPKEFIHNINDAHIYLNHIEGVKKQLERIPTIFPKIEIINHHKNITDYNINDFVIKEYVPQPYIKFDMAI